MEKVRSFLERERIYITKDALKLIEEFLEKNKNSTKLELILKEIKEIKGLVTKEDVQIIIQKYSNKGSLKELDMMITRERVSEPTSITAGFKGFLDDRFQKLKRIIEGIYRKRASLKSSSLANLSEKTSLTIAGTVFNKEEGKFDSIILELEDDEGIFRAIVPKYKKEAYEIASKLDLDEVILIDGIVMKGAKGPYVKVTNIYTTDLEISREIKEVKEDYLVAIISDIRLGHRYFDAEAFLNFIDFLNNKFSEYEEFSRKIKYLMITGDLVEGLSIFSKHYLEEEDDLYEDYQELANILSKIRQDITIYCIPGERDDVIGLIPFQKFDQEVAEPLFELKNVELLEDPSMVNISERKFLLTHGYYFEETFEKKIKEIEDKEKIIAEAMTERLRKRYLLPSIRIEGLLPLGYDPFVITEKPDVFACGHFGIAQSSVYRGCLLISNSSWINYPNKKNEHSCYLISIKDLSLKKLLF